VGFQDGAPSRWVATPGPDLTLLVTLEGPVRADGALLPAAWVGGLSDAGAAVELGAPHASVDLKITPLGAYTLLGLPLHELAGTQASLEDLFGAPGRRLAEAVAEAPGWDARFDLLEAFLLRRAREGPAPSPAVAAAWARLRGSGGRVMVGTLAEEAGWSRRHLVARFREQVGLPPKTVARVLRFAEVLRRIDADPVRWAEVAAACGYADQSHLNRDFRRLVGTTPTAYLADRPPRPEVTSVQDAGARRA
jgi:AraC-like DNA-binding protein